MADGNLPDIETLRKMLAYDPGTGSLTWRHRPASMFSDGKQSAEHNAAAWNGRYAGMGAFETPHRDGYRQGAIFGRRHLAHRVAFALHHGRWPADQLDHINGDQADNRAVNLRNVTHAENQRNTKRRATNTSGVMGVYWRKRDQKWQAMIWLYGRGKSLGYFTDFDSAVASRKAAEAEFGFHPNHGRPQ